MAITKACFAENISNRIGFTQVESKEIVDLFFDTIKDSLECGEQVKISGLGKFKLIDKRSRPGRNPKTGESVPVSARRVVAFHSSPQLKARVAMYKG